MYPHLFIWQVKVARADLYDHLRETWITDIPDERLHFYLICTLLDPRLKKLNIPLLTETIKDDAREAFKAEYDLNWAPVVVPVEPTDPPVASVGNIGSPTPSLPSCPGSVGSINMSSFTDFLTYVAHLQEEPEPASQPVTQPVASTTILNQVDIYLAELPVSMDTDILVWWGVNEHKYPDLARMAAQFLGCPASSASAERVFSLAGRLYDDLASHMNDGTLEERMWAKINRNKLVPVVVPRDDAVSNVIHL